jgi:ABC-2 type transport system ATP-binding protein
LRAVARRSGVGDRRVDVVLDRVGLAARAGDAVSAYSYGMRQRLGVAVAILKDPRLLILDEPSNGLDPAGQLDMRQLIQELRGGGRTIVLSSHDMEEVEQLCDRVGIIGDGRLLAEGTPEQLRGATSLQVRAEPADQAAALAATLVGADHVGLSDGSLTLTVPDLTAAGAAAITRQLVGAGLEVSEVRAVRRPLREVFLMLTGRRTGGADSVRAGAHRGAAGHPGWWHRRHPARDAGKGH